MANGQITWEQFITSNNDARGVRYKFEDLCRQLFVFEFLSKNKINKYLHSNPNNAGIESEPILNEESNQNIGYQAKFFDNVADYGKIKESAEKAVLHYAGKLDCIYLFCNKALTTTCDNYKNIESLLKVAGIELIPITDTTILDLVRKYPLLGKYYFDDHGVTYEWLLNHANRESSVLGECYNPEFNVDTVTAKNLSIFLQDKNAVIYFNNKKKKLINKLISLRWELSDHIDFLRSLREFIDTIPDIDFNSIHDVEHWQDKVNERFNDDIIQIESKIDDTQSQILEIRDSSREKVAEYRLELNKLEKLLNLYHALEITESEKKLLNNKVLIVEGSAGIGKSHLFANETFEILNDNECTLLIIAGECLADSNILEQVKNNLRISFQFEDLIDILDVIGASREKIIPILIDAVNESWKPKLWKSVLPLLHNKICDKEHVRLAISFRNEYEKSILPENFLELNGVVKMEHQGFRGNSIEAAKEFLAHYGIPFTPIQMFTNRIDNPLFLTLYCKTYQGDEVGLQVLYDRLLEKANDKIYDSLEDTLRVAGFEASDNLVLMIVDAISKEILANGNRRFEKKELEKMSIWHELNLSARPVIRRLIQENILHGYESDEKEYLYFAYDQMNDYYPAKVIMDVKRTEEELRDYLTKDILGIVNGEMKNWANVDLFVNTCALFAEKFRKECIDIIDSIDDEDDQEFIFRTYLESFEWRIHIYLSLENFLKYCKKYGLDSSVVWNAFITNSVKPNHLLNADALHSVLMRYPLNKRDYLWTKYINGICDDDARVVQLVEAYHKGELLQITDKEQIRLLLLLFSWILTSSNRWLRDITSKAIIEILKENFEFCEYLLENFDDVNDPYVIQRLYGVVFGACVKRIDDSNGSYRSLVYRVYENIFNKEIVYPDILLRDYARLIIERYIFEYPNVELNIEVNKIKPPYKSIPIPEIEDMKYSDKKLEGGEFYIQHSMRFEGIGMYGDFGRYVFQSAVRNFEVDNYKIFNYSMYYIWNDLGYDKKLFDDYDRFVYGRHNTLKTERIGKKYQWIAMYNVLARISDFYPMKNRFSMEEKVLAYDGPWEPYVRDFDPTLNTNKLFNPNVPLFYQVNDHIKDAVQENKQLKNESNFDGNAWTKANTIFFEHQKQDLLLIDHNGSQWVVLSKYADTGRYDLAHDKLMVWNWLYGYFVSEKQLATLKEYATKGVNLLCQDIIRIPETYTLYNREYPWSAGSASILEHQYKDVSLPTGETKTITTTVEMPDFSAYEKLLDKYMEKSDEGENLDDSGQETVDSEISIDIPVVPKTYTREEPVTVNLGKILNTTQDLLWEEEFDASKEESLSYSHPCAELITTLGLRQTIYDGYYYDADGTLVAFDTDLTKQKAGLVIRKSVLDKFLSEKKLHLVWFVNAAKEIHDSTLMITNYTDWSGLLVYTGDSVEGEYYTVERR